MLAHATSDSKISEFVDPGLLNRFKNFLAATLRVIIKLWQSNHPAVQVRKTNLSGIDFRVRLRQGNSKLKDIGFKVYAIGKKA